MQTLNTEEMKTRHRWFGEQQRFKLMLIAPAATLLLLFQVMPIIIGANASFRDWALNNPKKTWVGLSQYVSVLTDPAFLQIVLPNTFVFMVASVALSLAAGFALALALNRPFRGQKLVQTVLLVPLMVAPVIAAIMVRWMFNDQFGIVNVVLEAIGLESQPAGITISNGQGATTCAYIYPDNKSILYASTHLGGRECPPRPGMENG